MKFDATWDTVVIGLSSLLVAALSYVSSSRAASRALLVSERADTERTRSGAEMVEAQAYERAQKIYESALSQQEQQITELKNRIVTLEKRIAALESVIRHAALPLPEWE
jgi:TolA-binding protein